MTRHGLMQNSSSVSRNAVTSAYLVRRENPSLFGPHTTREVGQNIDSTREEAGVLGPKVHKDA